jgi:hypothetical protein
VDVVAVEGDVECSEGELGAAPLRDEAAQARGQRHSARLDADERDTLEFVVPLDDLVRDAPERFRDRLRIEQDGRGRAIGDVRGHRSPFRPR